LKSEKDMADTETKKSESNETISDADAQFDASKIDAEVLQNIPVTVSVEVGRTSLKIRDLMRLAQGSVVELDRLAGESLDLMVNNTPVAQGEIVLVNERYGIKLTSVIPTVERVKNL
jgi:flagellar motor switch protein FliN/FliY